MAKNTLITFIIVLAVVAVGVFYFGYQKGYGVGYKKGEEVGWATVQVGAGEAVTNPLEKMPSTNPFAETVNPFKELYKNPFK